MEIEGKGDSGSMMYGRVSMCALASIEGTDVVWRGREAAAANGDVGGGEARDGGYKNREVDVGDAGDGVETRESRWLEGICLVVESSKQPRQFGFGVGPPVFFLMRRGSPGQQPTCSPETDSGLTETLEGPRNGTHLADYDAAMLWREYGYRVMFRGRGMRSRNGDHVLTPCRYKNESEGKEE
ncbi:hypothetical protein VTJ49DRAFT_2397 [Mycothermus thermophilus]|uniref:Uncharacterized protein n=1 Tax=Humicola insolens TaxID=85995 RepID=A0ABR3VQ40_HUMIN